MSLSLPQAISIRNRAKKFRQFLSLLQPNPTDTILDVGITEIEYAPGDNYLEGHYSHPEQITAVSKTTNWQAFHEKYPQVTTVTADGRALPFADNSFSIVYSNAVIEHVGPISDQIQFLKELYRVAPRGYLTTPNRHFPIEVHTRIPLLHLFLPKKWFDRVLVWIGKEWATGDYMHLLSRRDLERLLGRAGIDHFTLLPNRFLGFPLTYTVVWTKSSPR